MIKSLLVSLLLFAQIPFPGPGRAPVGGGGVGYALVPGATISANGSFSPSTTSIDTTGVDLLIVTVSYFNPTQSTTPYTVVDNKSNTFTPRTVYNTGTNSSVAIYYAQAPTVGSGHTFTATSAEFASICVAGFSGSITSPFDQENGNGSTSTSSIQPGSVTPSENNELVISGVVAHTGGDPFSINSGFTIAVQNDGSPSSFPGGLAYIIQTSAAAVNPSWSLAGSGQAAAAIATFKAAP